MKLSFVSARTGLALMLVVGLFLTVVDHAAAGHGCAVCVSSCPTYQTVEKTIYVPQMVPEQRVVNQTVCRPEVRERTVTVCRQIPETRQVTENYTVMVPQQHVRTEHYMVCRPVWSEVEQTYDVCIPQVEPRRGVRNVCRSVPVQESRTVTRNVCVWENVPCDGSCGGYGTVVQKGELDASQKGAVQKGGETIVQKASGCGGTHRVLRNHCVTEQMPVTVWRTEVHQEDYNYNVTTYRTEQRKRMVRVCNYVQEKASRDVTYTVCVPEQRSRTRDVTTYRTVYEPQRQQYTVMVPHTVQREVTVMVCHMVPQQVTCTVPVYGCGGNRCCY